MRDLESCADQDEDLDSIFTGIDIGIKLEDPSWVIDLPHCRPLVHRAVMATYVLGGFSEEASSVATSKIVSAELSVVLSDDASVQVLNRNYRGKDKATNVLSFAALDDPDEEALALQRGVLSLGDIVLSRETLIREASDQSKRLEDHFTHLLVHGVLHLLGYDHLSEDEAIEMEGLEVDILSRLGVADPYMFETRSPQSRAIDE
ncbi:rRNA maturation RNase YbeY [Kiloniella laminariae]